MMKLTNISLVEEKTGRYLVQDLDLTINDNTKLAIIGEEGNGKSSLLQVIRERKDLIPYLSVSGEITSSYQNIGYLNQSLVEENGQLVVAILAKNPDFLLLDEPTNNLDLASIKWLEDFVKNITIPVVFVSHDEAFIQETANELLHLELTKRNQEPLHTLSHDDFFTYKEKREQGIKTHNQLVKNENRALKKQEDKLQQVWNKAEHQHTQVSRADPRLQKKVKALKQQKEKLSVQKDQVMDLRTIEENPSFFFAPVSSPKKKQLILDFTLDELTNEKGVLSRNIALPIFTQDKIIITGENGVGKSTLLKQVYLALNKKSNYNVGYMPQKYEEVVDTSQHVLSLLNTTRDNEEQKIRTLLANLNFTRDEMPTRNLSPLTNQVFYDALSQYQGTIISISHDRKYIDSLKNKKLYELTSDELRLKEYVLD